MMVPMLGTLPKRGRLITREKWPYRNTDKLICLCMMSSLACRQWSSTGPRRTNPCYPQEMQCQTLLNPKP